MKNIPFILICFVFSCFTVQLEANNNEEVKTLEEFSSLTLTNISKETPRKYSGEELSPRDTIKEDLPEQYDRSEVESTNSYVDLSKSGEKKKANKLFRDLGFMASAEYYQEMVSKGKVDAEIMEHLAKSYRLNGDTENAEYWYARVVKDTDNAEHFLQYAQMLQSNEKCEDAIRWFERYKRLTGDESRSFITNCGELEEMVFERGAELTNMESINTSHLDFSPVKYKKGVVFTSTRGLSKVAKHIDLWTQDNFSDLFYAERFGQHSGFLEAKPLDGDINGKFHDGVATFNSGGNVMVFTRNNYKGKSDEGLIDLQLYESKLENKGKGDFWGEVTKLNINSDEFASCHPSLSQNGKRLYFASNRPGGYGGLDIYVSKKVGNQWQEPENLGPIINTSGNELFPFIDVDERLYFASNGHKGLGGLDIYVAQKTDKKDESSWNMRDNIGSPLNSPKDDFGFMVVEADKTGFLTSNRDGGKGGDDIYQWTILDGSKLGNNPKPQERKICVFDPDTGDRIPDAKVSILPAEGSVAAAGADNELVLVLKRLEDRQNEYVLSLKDRDAISSSGDFFKTDENGEFTYPVIPGQEFMFVVEKSGYELTRKKVSASDILSETTYCLPLKKRNCLVLEGKVKNKNLPKYIPNAKVTIVNKCTGEVFETTSDADGEFDYCLDCDCDYEIFAEKKFFKSGFTTVSTREMECIIPGVVEALVELEIGNVQDQLSGNPNGNNPNGMYPDPNSPFNPIQGPLTPEALRRYFLGDPNGQFNVGQVLTLRHIYYDYDKYYIRPDAAAELDYVAALMRHYSSMEIGLESHTDARASDRYNQWLSNNRAKEARKYLINHGVQPHRIHFAVGKSEHYLTNRCADGVECSEAEHQMNRRTEIIIQRFSEPGIRVESK